MSIFLFYTSDRIKKEPFEKVFADHGPVIYGIGEEKKIFFDGKNLNYYHRKKFFLPHVFHKSLVHDQQIPYHTALF